MDNDTDAQAAKNEDNVTQPLLPSILVEVDDRQQQACASPLSPWRQSLGNTHWLLTTGTHRGFACFINLTAPECARGVCLAHNCLAACAATCVCVLPMVVLCSNHAIRHVWPWDAVATIR